MSKDPIWLSAFSALLGTGIIGYVYDFWKQRRLASATPMPVREQAVSVAMVDANLGAVARARDELGEDNDRLRGVLAEERANAEVLRRTLYTERERHTAERHEWEARDQRHIVRIDALEARVTELLDELHRLRAEMERERAQRARDQREDG